MNLKYKIELANKKVEKQLVKLPKEYKKLIAKNLIALEKNPRPNGIKKLGDKIYRIRVGRYRVIYEINDDNKLIVITKIRKRDDNTYNDL